MNERVCISIKIMKYVLYLTAKAKLRWANIVPCPFENEIKNDITSPETHNRRLP